MKGLWDRLPRLVHLEKMFVSSNAENLCDEVEGLKRLEGCRT